MVKAVCDPAALMRARRGAESGTVPELPAALGFDLARELVPLGEEPAGEDRTVLDVTFHGGTATEPIILRLSRTYHIDISILGAAMETVGGRQVGRMRIELPGGYEGNVVPVGRLREQGLTVEVPGTAGPGPGPGRGPGLGTGTGTGTGAGAVPSTELARG